MNMIVIFKWFDSHKDGMKKLDINSYFRCCLRQSVPEMTVTFLHITYKPTSTLNLSKSPESQWNLDSNNTLSVRKYSQLFTHQSNRFLLNIWPETTGPIGPNNPKIHHFPLSHVDPHSIHHCLGHPTHHGKVSVHALRHNYAATSPMLTMGSPQFTHKTAPSIRRLPSLSNTHIPRLTVLTIPNGIWIHSAVLPQYTFQTDRHTVGQMG